MRKYKRNILRNEAKQDNLKASKWVRNSFDLLQAKKYGRKTRDINKAKGTHKKRTWRIRIPRI